MADRNGDRRRRALTHVGGDVETWSTEGEARSAEGLARALAVLGSEEGGEEAARAHVHGFHTYPARLHPDTAARLVSDFAPEGGTVLDPFCGSGTVVVESLLLGRSAIGVDLNPLAVLLARVKATPLTRLEGERILDAARAIAEAADARRQARAGATRRFPPEDVELFAPHVLLELDGLRAGIEKLEEGPVRDALSIVLGALLVKVSQKRGDTAGPRNQSRDRGRSERAGGPRGSTGAPEAKRVASGFTIRFFVTKAEDLVRRRAELTSRLPPVSSPAGRARIALDDATELRSVGASTVDAIVTSPPYAATYDYLEHHALRLRWLNLDARRFQGHELGARRSYARLRPEEARERWLTELSRFLRAAARVTRERAAIVLVLGDSAIRGGHARDAVALRAEEMVALATKSLALDLVARASQPRPHFHGPTASAFRKRARREHALLLRRRKG